VCLVLFDHHSDNQDFLAKVRAHDARVSCNWDMLNIENPTPKNDMSIAVLKMRPSELRAMVAAASSCGTLSIASPCRENPRATICELSVAILMLAWWAVAGWLALGVT